MKIDEKKRMQELVSGHRTGLPDKLLRLFNARPPLEPNKGPPRRGRPPKLPYTGLAQYVQLFAEPGDPEYEPPAPETRPPEPRIFTNPELPSQVGLALLLHRQRGSACVSMVLAALLGEPTGPQQLHVASTAGVLEVCSVLSNDPLCCWPTPPARQSWHACLSMTGSGAPASLLLAHLPCN